MWQLVRENGGQTYHFLTGTDYVVGRKNCTILIEDDQSISRAHAAFSVSHPVSSLGQPEVIPVLTIKDSSKYGTFINGQKMENAVSRTLKSGDKVTFGVYNSKFRVTYEPLVACSSCLNGSEKNSLTQSMLVLGGHVVNNWTEKCTHLVMNSVKVTIKTISALICGRSIIKPEYFNEMIKALRQKEPLPALTSFIPIIDEPSLQSESLDLSENAERKTIFKDKTFLFLTTKQHKKLSPAIHFGRGKAILLKGELDEQSLLENPNTCVIDVGVSESQLSESPSTPTWITSTMNILQSKGLRTIPEAEIGLAVIYMSTEIYCNPRQRSANRNENERTTRNNIVESALSASMAVDETVLPAATFNTTAYVANTEPQDQTHTWMDISRAREVKETPTSNRRSIKPSGGLEEDLEAGTSGDCRTALFQEKPTPAEKRTPRFSQIETSASNKEKVSQKMEPSNKIQNYFQPVAKKRDRDEDESETSTSKLARVERVTSKPGKDLCPPKESQADRRLASTMDPDLDVEPVVLSNEKSRNSNHWPNVDMETTTTNLGKEASTKKRKEPDDVVEESDLESEDEFGDEVHQNNPKSNVNKVKRPRAEAEDDFGGDIKMESQDRGATTAPPSQKVKSEPDIKQEQESQYEHTKMLILPKAQNDDGLPNKLLLSEFRSLVVSRPARNSQLPTNANHGDGPNFKKFRKIAYPGAGNFPHIIGGSDLIAHDRKKNSELEQWLRQEMEEQTQQAREQSLAEDLFRYNPKTVKRRR